MRFLLQILALLAANFRESLSVGRIVPLQSGDHLDDIFKDTRVNRPPSLIFFYSSDIPTCNRNFVNWDLEGLPSRAHLFMGKYDLAQQKNIWFSGPDNEDIEFDLRRRFNIAFCPSVVFIPGAAGPWVGQPQEWRRWDGGSIPWREWFWSQLGHNMTLVNSLEVPVVLTEVGPEEAESQIGSLSAGEELVVQVHTSSTLTAWSHASVVWRRIFLDEMRHSSECLVLSITEDPLDAESYASEVQRLADLSQLMNGRDQDTTFTHSAILRQPPLMNSFGKTSYFLMDMPPVMRQTIDNFYTNHRENRIEEYYMPATTGINQHEVNTSLVSLDWAPDLKETIATQMIQPFVEEWAGMPLVFTSLYGIREYYRGNELRMHVDRVATHVFSVIINVDQQGVDEDWPLEVIEFDGTRNEVIMAPGQMLFYQSAKLIHGRPKSFQGELYANLFCHFKPREGWDYVYGGGDVLLLDGKVIIDYKVD